MLFRWVIEQVHFSFLTNPKADSVLTACVDLFFSCEWAGREGEGEEEEEENKKSIIG